MTAATFTSEQIKKALSAEDQLALQAAFQNMDIVLIKELTAKGEKACQEQADEEAKNNAERDFKSGLVNLKAREDGNTVIRDVLLGAFKASELKKLLFPASATTAATTGANVIDVFRFKDGNVEKAKTATANNNGEVSFGRGALPGKMTATYASLTVADFVQRLKDYAAANPAAAKFADKHEALAQAIYKEIHKKDSAAAPAPAAPVEATAPAPAKSSKKTEAAKA